MALSSSPEVRILGRYALFDQIAAGGMASVHIGRLIGPVGFSRTVAIKRLHPQYAREPDFVAMFLDEARLAARIRHPNVVGTLDIVATDGELFLVMEYVQGESLARLLRTVRERGEPVPIPICASIIVGALEGLYAAHEATDDQGEPLGIVHRDVSPQNILVGTDGVTRVVDFGVAKAGGRVQSTRDGQLKGKLGYMAPEQIRGYTTRATDIHAAAVVLWEMLTSRRLYHADNDMQTFQNILAGNVVPPSQYAAGISARLDRLVLQGLAPDPAARFDSARDMARALQTAMPVAAAHDVGDWVDSLAAGSLSSRARKIAAIESSGVLPSASSSASLTPEPFDGLTRPPPASTRAGAVRRAVIGLLVLLVTLGLGAAIGVRLRTPARASSPTAAPATTSPVAPAVNAALAPTGAKATVAAVPPPAMGAPSVSAAPPRSVDAMDLRRTNRPAAPAAAPAKPSTETGGDLSHVMDSRK